MEAFIPDLINKWTVKEAEEKLASFKFHGPGWYMPGPFNKSNDTLLVMSTDDKDVFTFNVYTNRNPVDTFCWIGRCHVWNQAIVFDDTNGRWGKV